MRHWYQDRDFPEIKAENLNAPNDILAVVESKEQRWQLIDEHNKAIWKLRAAEARVAQLERSLKEIIDKNESDAVLTGKELSALALAALDGRDEKGKGV